MFLTGFFVTVRGSQQEVYWQETALLGPNVHMVLSQATLPPPKKINFCIILKIMPVFSTGLFSQGFLTSVFFYKYNSIVLPLSSLI